MSSPITMNTDLNVDVLVTTCTLPLEAHLVLKSYFKTLQERWEAGVGGDASHDFRVSTVMAFQIVAMRVAEFQAIDVDIELIIRLPPRVLQPVNSKVHGNPLS